MRAWEDTFDDIDNISLLDADVASPFGRSTDGPRSFVISVRKFCLALSNNGGSLHYLLLQLHMFLL